MLRILHLIRLVILATFPSRGRLLSCFTDENGSTKALPYRLIFNAYIISQKRDVEDVVPYKFSFPYAIYSLSG